MHLCHLPEDEPPEVPLVLRLEASGNHGASQVLESGDGSRFRAYLAPAQRSEVGVVIAPDTRGLHAFYERLARCFAAAGIHAIAFDYYGRTAGVGGRPTGFDFRDHDARNEAPELKADLTTAAGYLRRMTGTKALYIVGFCKGGRLAFNAAADHDGVAGVIGFYGTPAARRTYDHVGSPLANVDRMQAPVLGLFGGADPGIPIPTVQAFASALEARALPHYIHIYPGAPHSFFDRAYAQHRSSCDDAWRRVLGFLRTGDPTATGERSGA